MEPFPLTTLLALRRREEEAAEAEWTAALGATRAAEARLAALQAAGAAARRALDEARAAGEPGDGGALAAGDVATRQRFVARRHDEWKEALATEIAFRDGPLAAARAAEVTARDAHEEKRRAREAVEKHQERWLSEAHRQAERRAEDARDDLTAAAQHRRNRDP